jgi:hypothetical protein
METQVQRCEHLCDKCGKVWSHNDDKPYSDGSCGKETVKVTCSRCQQAINDAMRGMVVRAEMKHVNRHLTTKELIDISNKARNEPFMMQVVTEKTILQMSFEERQEFLLILQRRVEELRCVESVVRQVNEEALENLSERERKDLENEYKKRPAKSTLEKQPKAKVSGTQNLQAAVRKMVDMFKGMYLAAGKSDEEAEKLAIEQARSMGVKI